MVERQPCVPPFVSAEMFTENYAYLLRVTTLGMIAVIMARAIGIVFVDIAALSRGAFRCTPYSTVIDILPNAD